MNKLSIFNLITILFGIYLEGCCVNNLVTREDEEIIYEIRNIFLDAKFKDDDIDWNDLKLKIGNYKDLKIDYDQSINQYYIVDPWNNILVMKNELSSSQSYIVISPGKNKIYQYKILYDGDLIQFINNLNDRDTQNDTTNRSIY